MVELESYNEWLVEKDADQTDWKTLLRNGNYFTKHHSWGKPKLRLVWTDESLEVINWGDPKDQKSKGSIKVSDIKEIKDGLAKSSIKDKDSELRLKCCFSLITTSRTLELECPTLVTLSRS